MYALLASCDVQVPPEDVVFHEDLHDKQAQYKTEMEGAQKAKDDKMAEMVSVTEANISKLEEQIAGVVVLLDDDIYMCLMIVSNEADRLLEWAAGPSCQNGAV